MIEALFGIVGDVQSYLDYGYFGVVGAEFDENGFSVGSYTPKPSFKALQNLCSIFCNDYTNAKLPIENVVEFSPRMLGDDFDFAQARSYGFTKPNGSSAICYWNPKNILTETYEGTFSIRITLDKFSHEFALIDLLDGSIYKLPDSMIVKEGDLTVKLSHLPNTESPMLLTFGNFYS